MVRRHDTEAAGLLDERYFMYFEDVDFCAAVRAHGRGVLFTPAAEIVHLRGHSRAQAAEATARAYRSSQVAFYQRHHPLLVPFLRMYLKLKSELPDTSIKP
jgi:GT2 family glycosyltransferase